MNSPLSRNPLMDAIKGLACAAIVWHHLAFYGPMSDVVHLQAPTLMEWLYDNARMAVQVFLVLGGYLAAASLAPQRVARFDSVGAQLLRRFVRLLVPYAVALLLAIVVAALVRPWFDHPSVPEAPSLAQLLAHALLLQDVVGEEALSAGVWYVAIDFQLFALSTVLLAGVRAWPGLPRRSAATVSTVLVLVFTAASLWFFNRDPAWDAWGWYFFGAYGLGMLSYWAVHASRPGLWLAGIALLGALALGLEFRARIAVALGTALGLVLLMRRPLAVSGWSGIALLQRWGQMSYSIFLVHFSVCLLANAVVSYFWPQDLLANSAGLLLAFGLSLRVGRILYQRVECRVPAWSMAWRWQASLIGMGLLVAWLELLA